jgi:hypothetical protein
VAGSVRRRRCGRGGGSVPVPGLGVTVVVPPSAVLGAAARSSVLGGGFAGGICGAREDVGALQLFLRRPGGCGRPGSSAPAGTLGGCARRGHRRRERVTRAVMGMSNPNMFRPKLEVGDIFRRTFLRGAAPVRCYVDRLHRSPLINTRPAPP